MLELFLDIFSDWGWYLYDFLQFGVKNILTWAGIVSLNLDKSAQLVIFCY